MTTIKEKLSRGINPPYMLQSMSSGYRREALVEIERLATEIDELRAALEQEHNECCQVVAAFEKSGAELRAKLAELESQQPIGFLCHGHFYKWPSEDDYCGNVEDHILLYAAQVKDIKSGPVYNANCIRHPAAPHGVDVEASWRVGHTVCVCQSWTPGEAS